ncbi:four helix bundle protein [Arthrospira sp. O9.13F]|nr:four helix bundle protein [Arthrospira sp. O9.13F]
MESFEELDCWKRARSFRMLISDTVKFWPSEERYELTKQIKRSTRSVTANIAEGFGRHHHQENIQFCRQARGSLTESLDHLITAQDEGFISDSDMAIFREEYGHCLRLLNGYIAYLRTRGAR